MVKRKIKVWVMVIAFLVSLIPFYGAANFGATNTVYGAASQSNVRTITDMAGRKLKIPVTIKKAYATSQIGIITLYTLNPDKLAGWGFALQTEEKKYISPKYYKLPVLGVWSGKNGSGNLEEIAKVHPDVIFSIGDLEKTSIDLANKIQKQTGIPVVMVDGPLTGMDKTYDFVGSILNEKAKAAQLSAYCKQTISEIKQKIGKLPADKKVKVYYAEGPKGLETDPSGSFHTEVLDFVGGINAAKVEAKSGFGRSEVSAEQLLAWNPDVVIIGYDKDAEVGLTDKLYADPVWQKINAAKNKRIYQIPSYPYDWFDRPPSSNRLIGVKWLANLLYPDIFKFDMIKEVKNFYNLFYHTSITTKDAKELLGTSVK